MTKILPFVLGAAMLAAVPINAMAAVQVANSANSAYCEEGGPESYQRPGGFCDELDVRKSLPTKNGGSDGCMVLKKADASEYLPGGTLLALADPCCDDWSSLTTEGLIPADGLLVAVGCNPY